ncbi:FH1/FH2 domain-containing protein 1 isoform X2 [Gouania willdenowi]|uniref:FH1/FH2 domain-containing protein 1 isoform X2 n=1 Tax=Gouania willdenowi TaxID=441366 RepID=UPI0010566678|nr:FH1/FH2 domain-containing protein 1-like isoform X2 [Gouania willdenowi]
MKEAEQSKDSGWDLEQPWGSFLKPSACLCLNTLDFTDLWDEEDDAEEPPNIQLKLSSADTPTSPGPPPPPPLSPLGASPFPKGASNKTRTLKLHWRELQNLSPLPRMTRFGTQTIWAGLEPVCVDTNLLEYLFETKGSNTGFNVGCVQQPPTTSVLGIKRSNIIAIALSSLPPPRLLPPAIYSMDSSVLDREDVQRLQSLIPTEEELCLIKETKSRNPNSRLGQAELCLLTLGEIPNLSSRLQLWAFAMDYDSLEREIAEPLFHLKLAMEQLAGSHTFRCILATVLAIGNFLNGCKARGFELSYLGKLSQVRDTHSRQPLLHHVCVLLLQLYPQSSDLYSDITAVTKASKCDYSQVQSNFVQLEALCKASWEQLKILDKSEEKKKGAKGGKVNESEGSLRHRLPKTLKECEQRLKVLKAVHRRVINRFHSFLLFLGYSRVMVRETKAEDFCKSVSNFSLEYRTMRENVLLQREREQQKENRDRVGGSTPVGRRRCQQPPSQVHHTRTYVPHRSSHPEVPILNVYIQESDEQTRLEEILKTPTSSSIMDVSLPRNRRKMSDLPSRITQYQSSSLN